ncbi:MAG: hypothetical protein EAZ55_09470 [Cytophagales bacterium]|nr:MAG: hypothetical protein EAZ55_09470 [Cytophagales bacterium]
MMQKNKVLFLGLFLMLFLGVALQSFAQETEIEWVRQDSIDYSSPKTTHMLMFGMTAQSYFLGDLSASPQKWSNAFHVSLRFNRKERVNGCLYLGVGFITAENIFYKVGLPAERKLPNTFFRTEMLNFVGELHYNIIKRRNFAFYVGQGIGLSRFVVYDKDGNPLSSAASSRARGEEYGNITLLLPTSVGVFYLLKNGYGVGAQLSLFNPMTDYLDNIGQWGTQSGNDNVMALRISVIAPLKRIFPPKIPNYTHQQEESAK